MRVEAYILYEGHDYEGRNVMGIFSDEPSAFAEMIDLMSGSFLTLRYRLAGPDGAAVVDTFGALPATLSLGSGQLAPDFYDIVHYDTEGAYQLKQKWTKGVNPFNNDIMWMARKQG